MGELSCLSRAGPPGTINRTWLSRRLNPQPSATPSLRLLSVLLNITGETTGRANIHQLRWGITGEAVSNSVKMSRVVKSTAVLFICFPSFLSPHLSFGLYSITGLSSFSDPLFSRLLDSVLPAACPPKKVVRTNNTLASRAGPLIKENNDRS